jgi:hypothetical protein
MNIFVLDEDYEKCAQYHVDKHVVCMIKEYGQLLSSAVRLSGIDAGYKLTHQNHPAAVWVRQSLTNWIWLRKLARHVNDEYKFRYGRTENHKSYGVITSLPMPNIESIGMTKFPQIVPEDCVSDDPIEAYRNFYMKHKRHIANWKNRPIPEWYK